jgi:two-component system, OmpR family, sensor histidine kinase VanS
MRVLPGLSVRLKLTVSYASFVMLDRIALEGHKDEFRELADSFDAMLARLEAHVAEQRRFAANASHELRTPLAITQTLLDVARNDPARGGGDLDERLRAVNARRAAPDIGRSRCRGPAGPRWGPRARLNHVTTT